MCSAPLSRSFCVEGGWCVSAGVCGCSSQPVCVRCRGLLKCICSSISKRTPVHLCTPPAGQTMRASFDFNQTPVMRPGVCLRLNSPLCGKQVTRTRGGGDGKEGVVIASVENANYQIFLDRRPETSPSERCCRRLPFSPGKKFSIRGEGDGAAAAEKGVTPAPCKAVMVPCLKMTGVRMGPLSFPKYAKAWSFTLLCF